MNLLKHDFLDVVYNFSLQRAILFWVPWKVQRGQERKIWCNILRYVLTYTSNTCYMCKAFIC